MSSTSGHWRESNPLDFHETPPDAIEDLLLHVPELLYVPRGTGGWYGDQPVYLDPGCGTGVIALYIEERYNDLFGYRPPVIGVELDDVRAARAREDNLEVISADFTQMVPTDFAPTHIAGNPPFNAALPFIETGLALLQEGGLLAYLLRTDFLGSGSSRLHVLRPPGGLWRVVSLTDRPSFCLAVRCRKCGGAWQYPRETRMRDAVHPPGGGCALIGRPPRHKTPYAGSRTDSCNYAWFVWQKGFEGALATLAVTDTRK